MSELAASDLRELINYDANTGLFTWKKKRRGVPLGKELGTDNGFGYKRITVLGRSYYAHRLAWLYQTGNWPDTIDHINGCKSDNRFSNLRSVTNSENAQNTHGATGVSWHKKANKWQSHVCIYKNKKYLGLFDTFEAANQAYINAKEQINVCLQKTQ